MPLYDYLCSKCGHTDTESFRMADVPTKDIRCPGCARGTYQRVFSVPNANTSKTLKTFGQQAERNAKRVGREGVEFMNRLDKRRRWEEHNAASEEVAAATGGIPTVLPKRFDDVVEDPALHRFVDKQTDGITDKI